MSTRPHFAMMTHILKKNTSYAVAGDNDEFILYCFVAPVLLLSSDAGLSFALSSAALRSVEANKR